MRRVSENHDITGAIPDCLVFQSHVRLNMVQELILAHHKDLIFFCHALSYLSLLPLLLELPLLLLLLLDPRLDLRQRLPRERAKGRTVLLGLKQLINTITINCFITYRVTMVVPHLGCVDLYFGSSSRR